VCDLLVLHELGDESPSVSVLLVESEQGIEAIIVPLFIEGVLVIGVDVIDEALPALFGGPERSQEGLIKNFRNFNPIFLTFDMCPIPKEIVFLSIWWRTSGVQARLYAISLFSLQVKSTNN
jgi:hypothetical protein